MACVMTADCKAPLGQVTGASVVAVPSQVNKSSTLVFNVVAYSSATAAAKM